MYKTSVYTLVNGRITHQEQQISDKGDRYHTARHCQVSIILASGPRQYVTGGSDGCLAEPLA